MRTTINILLCKLITKICHAFGRDGSVFPGSIIYKLDKNALAKIHYPKLVVAVTGSSGKGSTVSMIAHILEDAGKKVVWNKNGSNINNAIMTLILNNTKAFSKEVDAEVLLLEMDESYLDALPKNAYTHIVLTNITRDQPARNSHPKVIYDKIFANTSRKTTLVLNVDDSILNEMKYSCEGDLVMYGIGKTKYSSSSVPPYAVDGAYCPVCHAKLKYDCYHYGHLGIYYCPKNRKHYERGTPDVEATDVDLTKGTIKINGEEVKLNKKVFFAVYYTLASYALCEKIGIPKNVILDALNKDVMPSKRMKTYELSGRPIEMLESKNENALSYLQSLNYIKSQPGKKTVIMGFENVSRRYSYNDLSWLWDVNFELLKDDAIDKIFCIGRFKYDVATRLDYAEIDPNKIILVDDLNTLLDKVEKESNGNIYTMVCFDMTEIIQNLLKEKEHENKETSN